jgi:hypothetical protein
VELEVQQALYSLYKVQWVEMVELEQMVMVPLLHQVLLGR